MEQEKFLFVYDGPVKEFDRIVERNWHGETMAESEKKAKSNLAYQWKMMHDRLATSKVTLPGIPKMVP